MPKFSLGSVGGVCRSIKTLRPPVTPEPSQADVRAAALQYVRKVSGFREPTARHREAFDDAVARVAIASKDLLDAVARELAG
jgi:hypothetical protein